MKCPDCNKFMKKVIRDADDNEIEPYWVCLKCGMETEDAEEFDVY